MGEAAGDRLLPLGNSPAATHIFGKRVKADGTLLDGSSDSHGIPINTNSYAKSPPTIAFDGTNHLVAWVVGAYPGSPPAGVFGATVSPAGQVIDGQPDTLGIPFAGSPQSGNAGFGGAITYSNQSTTMLTWVQNVGLAAGSKSIQGILLFP